MSIADYSSRVSKMDMTDVSKILAFKKKIIQGADVKPD
jgi:hypothetical protein